jgi:prolipoprotein diacylglyceryltransferase
LWLHTATTIAVFLVLVDMIWKPGASEIVGVFPRAKDFNINFPLLVHITGAMILVGGMLGAASALVLARGDERKLKLGYYSLLFVAFPGMVLTKIGATGIWAKESPHNLIGAAFPHRDDPRWIEIGGTALDGGGALLVLALILGWFGVRRMAGAEHDLLTRIPLVKKLSGETLLKLTTAISVILLVGYVLAIWAMSTKPS